MSINTGVRDNTGQTNDRRDIGGQKDGRRGNRGQFRKGKSGNPRGRPKKKDCDISEALAEAVLRALNAKIDVNHGGKLKSMPVVEAIGLALVAGAMKATGVEKLKHIEAICKLIKQPQSKSNAGVIEPFSWTEEQEKLFAELCDLRDDDEPEQDGSEGQKPH